MIYLDNSATTRQYDEVTELMYRAAKENFGNPSSLHALGFEAGNLLYDARRQVEDLLPPAGRSKTCCRLRATSYSPQAAPRATTWRCSRLRAS